MQSGMPSKAALFKESDGVFYHSGAAIYAVGGYILGVAGLFQGSTPLLLPSTLLLANAMTVSAYLIHECGHHTVFTESRHNAMLGRFMSWICGAAYGTFDDMRYKHFRHHVDNDDVVWFEYDEFFENHPLLTKFIKTLEWFYIPAHDLVMHLVMVLTSFVIPERRNQRARNVVVLVIRGSVFVALLAFYPIVALCYMAAYMLMMHILRFMDALQHDYPYNATLFDVRPAPHRGDTAWEQEHTFSNPLTLRYEKLNWLVLNFGYHNAHHYDMRVPWYRLPALHRELTGGDPDRVIPFISQLKLYHRNRLIRVHNPQPDGYPQADAYLRSARTGEGAIGGNAASFLTSF